MIRRAGPCWGVGLATLLMASLATPALHADDSSAAPNVSDADKERAKALFTAGVERMRAEDFAGAAQSFEAALAIAPYAVIRYNLGLAYERLDRPVDAVAAMEEVLRNPGTLRPERLERAKQSLAEQQARIGRLRVAAEPAGAQISVDGRALGQAPLQTRLKAGVHYVEIAAANHAPFRQAVSLSAGGEASISAVLTPTQAQGAQLWIRSALAGAEVWLDGERIGNTPLEQSLAVVAGAHDIEIRREGYRTAQKHIDLRPGATGDVTLDLQVDKEALHRLGGTLVLTGEGVDELVVIVDGNKSGVYAGELTLPPGLHVLEVERSGFFPTSLEVTVPRGGRIEREVVLVPNAEVLADHNAEVALFNGLGWTLTGAAAITLGAGIGLTIDDGADEVERREAAFLPLLDNGLACDQSGASYDEAMCLQLADELDAARATRDQRRSVSIAMYVSSGALLATGVTLLLLAPDGDKYQRDFEDFSWQPLVAPTPGGAYVGVGRSF